METLQCQEGRCSATTSKGPWGDVRVPRCEPPCRVSQGKPLLDSWVSEVFNVNKDDNAEDKSHTSGVRKPRRQ